MTGRTDPATGQLPAGKGLRPIAEGLLGEVPVRLYRFQARTRPRWAARVDLPALGTPEAYGATPDEALRALAASLTTGDLERLRLHASPGTAGIAAGKARHKQ